MQWSVGFYSSKVENNQWTFDCFAYNIPTPAYPPYPGHEVLIKWLNENYPSVKCEIKHWLPPKSFGSYLEVIFDNLEDAMMFRMRFS